LEGGGPRTPGGGGAHFIPKVHKSAPRCIIEPLRDIYEPQGAYKRPGRVHIGGGRARIGGGRALDPQGA
jgi:hypothetical protein